MKRNSLTITAMLLIAGNLLITPAKTDLNLQIDVPINEKVAVKIVKTKVKPKAVKKVIKKPIPKVQTEVKKVVYDNTVSYAGQTYKYRRKVNIVATYYTNSVSDCGNTRGITASGRSASRGMVAVPHSIPFDTKIILKSKNGNKQIVSAQDRGGAIRWLDDNTMKIDVFIPNATHRELIEMGVKHYTGYILENNER